MRLRPLLVVAPVVLCVVVAACAGSDPDPIAAPLDAGSGFDVTSGTSGTSGASSGSTDAADANEARVECPEGCLALGTDGWVGPSAVLNVLDQSADITCPDPYTEHEVYARALGQTEAHTCSCPTPVSTLACSSDIDRFANQDCSGSPVATTDVSNCTSLSPPANSFKMKNVKLTGACQVPTPTPTKPAPKVDRTIVSCARKTDAACGGRTDCTAPSLPLPPPLSRLCIHHDDEIKCPSGKYSERIVVHKKIVDDRGCDPCTITATSCSSVDFAYGDINCAGIRSLITTADCVRSDFSPSLKIGQPVCKATAGAPTGELAGDNAVTFCCTAP